MNNDRILRFLSHLGAPQCPEQLDALVPEAGAIVTWLFSADGPVALADAAAWELVTSECYSEERDGHTWYRTHPTDIPLQLEDWERDAAVKVSQALRYLAARGVLASHPSKADLVRWPE